MHITPIPDEPVHALGDLCWCQPTVEDVPPEGRLVIHRRTLDSPRYEGGNGMTEEQFPDGESPVTEEEAKEKVEPPNNPDQEPGTDDLPATPEKEDE